MVSVRISIPIIITYEQVVVKYQGNKYNLSSASVEHLFLTGTVLGAGNTPN